MAEKTKDEKPAGWRQVARENDPERPAETAFDPARRQNYSVTRAGEIVWHGVPEGFRFQEDGTLVPKRDADVPETVQAEEVKV